MRSQGRPIVRPPGHAHPLVPATSRHPPPPPTHTPRGWPTLPAESPPPPASPPQLARPVGGGWPGSGAAQHGTLQKCTAQQSGGGRGTAPLAVRLRTKTHRHFSTQSHPSLGGSSISTPRDNHHLNMSSVFGKIEIFQVPSISNFVSCRCVFC